MQIARENFSPLVMNCWLSWGNNDDFSNRITATSEQLTANSFASTSREYLFHHTVKKKFRPPDFPIAEVVLYSQTVMRIIR